MAGPFTQRWRLLGASSHRHHSAVTCARTGPRAPMAIGARGPGAVAGCARRLTAREYRPKVCLAQDPRDLRALVALNFDLAVFHRASRAAGLLHRLGELLLFRQTDADKPFRYCHRLAAATGLLPDDVHPAAILPRRS